MVILSPAYRLLISTTVFAVASIVCYVISFFFNVWWITEVGGIKETQGLWKKCPDNGNNTDCVERTDLLSFNIKKGTDPIITCLLISTGFSLLIILFSLSMFCCCRKKQVTWEKSIKWLTFFVIVSFVAGVDGLLYAEFEFKDKHTRGWANMVAWAGVGFQAIMFTLIIVLLCVKPRLTQGNMNSWS